MSRVQLSEVFLTKENTSENLFGYYMAAFQSKDQSQIVVYSDDEIFQYNVSSNELVRHPKTIRDDKGELLVNIQTDCLNEQFQDWIIVEVYENSQLNTDTIQVFKYFLETKKYTKVIDILPTEEHFCHSLSKIHRNSPIAENDGLMVFKVIRDA